MAYYNARYCMCEQDCDSFLNVFSEFDFACYGDDCNYFCPECRNMLKCETYREYKDEWNTFYS